MALSMEVLKGSSKVSGRQWVGCFSSRQQVRGTCSQCFCDLIVYKLILIRAMGSSRISLERNTQRDQRLTRETSKMHGCNGSHCAGTRRDARVHGPGKGSGVQGVDCD